MLYRSIGHESKSRTCISSPIKVLFFLGFGCFTLKLSHVITKTPFFLLVKCSLIQKEIAVWVFKYGGQRWSRTTVLGFSDRRANRVRHLSIWWARRELNSLDRVDGPVLQTGAPTLTLYWPWCKWLGLNQWPLDYQSSALTIWATLAYTLLLYIQRVHPYISSHFFNPERSDNYSGQRMELVFFGNTNHFWL